MSIRPVPTARQLPSAWILKVKKMCRPVRVRRSYYKKRSLSCPTVYVWSDAAMLDGSLHPEVVPGAERELFEARVKKII